MPAAPIAFVAPCPRAPLGQTRKITSNIAIPRTPAPITIAPEGVVQPLVWIEGLPMGIFRDKVPPSALVERFTEQLVLKPRQGLTLSIPTFVYDGESDRAVAGAPIRLRINPTRGTIVNLDARSR